MTKDQLCALALAAIDDAETRQVLADAIEETGWWDERAEGTDWIKSGGGSTRIWSTADGGWVMVRRGDRGLFFSRAIAAVLLFGGWPTSWPLADRCETLSGRWAREHREMVRRLDVSLARAYASPPTTSWDVAPFFSPRRR